MPRAYRGGPDAGRIPISKHAVKVGRWLRSRRLELDLSLEQAAATSGVTAGYISEIETGNRDPYALTIRTTLQLMAMYRVSPETFMKRMAELVATDGPPPKKKVGVA